jgi:hypothetical protein
MQTLSGVLAITRSSREVFIDRDGLCRPSTEAATAANAAIAQDRVLTSVRVVTWDANDNLT